VLSLPDLQDLLAGVVVAGAIGVAAVSVLGLGLFFAAALRRRRRPERSARDLLASGQLSAALAAARFGKRADRRELLAAATAARHLLRLDQARELLARLGGEIRDPEAWRELGLLAAYEGRFAAAEAAFDRAARPGGTGAAGLELHRAWLDLLRGDTAAACRRFAPLAAGLEALADPERAEPATAEQLLQAAALWEACGDRPRADWARREGRAAAPESRLWQRMAPERSATSVTIGRS
jgi:tetratricopeptide (TPR) repeat protein